MKTLGLVLVAIGALAPLIVWFFSWLKRRRLKRNEDETREALQDFADMMGGDE